MFSVLFHDIGDFPADEKDLLSALSGPENTKNLGSSSEIRSCLFTICARSMLIVFF